MAYVNVLKLVKEYKQLNNVLLYGKVRCIMEKPDMLGRLEGRGGNFAIADICAIKFTGPDLAYKDTGYLGKKNIYFTTGSIMFYLSNEDIDKIGKLVIIGGKRGRDCTIKKQFSSGVFDGFQCFQFQKSGSDWIVSPNSIRLMKKQDVIGTDLEEYVLVDEGEGTVELPHSTGILLPFYAVKNDKVKELDPSKLNNKDSFNTLEKFFGANASFDDSVDSKELPRDDNGRIDISKIDMGLVKHLEAQKMSDLAPVVKEEVQKQEDRRIGYSRDVEKALFNAYKSELQKGVTILDIAEEIYSGYRREVVSRYDQILVRGQKEKGKYFVNKLLDSLHDINFASDEEESESADSKKSSKKRIAEGIDRVKRGVALNPSVFGPDFEEFVPILGDSVEMATIILANVLGLSEDTFVSNYNSCNSLYGMAFNVWFFSLIFYPYKLGLLGSGLSLSICDKVFFTAGSILAGRYCKEECAGNLVEDNLNMRDYLITFEALRKETSNISGTLVSRFSLMRNQYSYYSKNDKTLFKDNGLPLKSTNIELISMILQEKVERLDVKEMTESNPISNDILDNLVNIGILDTINDKYIAFSKDMYKEYFVYMTLIEKGMETTGITDDEVSKTIEDFETEKGFKLESLQKEGVALTKYKAAVLSGCAGSGKTTTSDCMSALLKTHFGEDYNIIYGTPTGKACRRLSEVVHSSVRTIHSLFGVGMDSEPYLGATPKSFPRQTKNIYIFDEMAMCNIDLMYAVVKNLHKDDLIYFLGDIKQLPPIGRGIPFSMLMTILPCVELGVSKRAASGSLINYNCMLINFLSDGVHNEELIGDDSTFVIRDCSDDMIRFEVLKMFKELLNGSFGKKYAEDDIYVITQYQTSKIRWSAPILNAPLQEFLRQNDRLLFYNRDKKFYLGERVIHTTKNRYDMKRYSRNEDGSFSELVTFGAVNGEVGKIVGVVRSDEITIRQFDPEVYKAVKEKNGGLTDKDQELLTKRERREDKLRDDFSISDQNIYFVIVEYWDTELEQNALVFYRGRDRIVSMDEFPDAPYFESADLSILDLAYALTAHKMQGSQEKAIIAVFGSTGSDEFVNRNMINVIFTRSQEFVGAIGSVKGEDSAISRGRKKKSARVRQDILGVLAGEVSI